MKFSEYQELAARTEKPLDTQIERLVHGLMGLTTEVGEMGGPIKATAIYGKPLDAANLEEELGDLLWYTALVANALGVDLDQVAEFNIGKLRKRYPERYTDAAAIERADKLDAA